MDDKIVDTKRCAKCTEELLLIEFNKKSASKDGLQSYCRTCQTSHENQYRILFRYKITRKQYDKKAKDQNYQCLICKKKRALFIDHDHSCCEGTKSCGKCLRDLLCDKCNRGLGYFDDSIEYLQEAIQYLNKHKERRSLVVR